MKLTSVTFMSVLMKTTFHQLVSYWLAAITTAGLPFYLPAIASEQ